MKLNKQIALSSVVTALLASAGSAGAAVYVGNGSTGFGGPIGTSSLTVTDSGSGNLNFSLTSPAGFSGNALILYVDTTPGGVGDTSTFTDTSDGGRTAISGFSSNGRTLATFASGFTADYAITVQPGVFGGLFNLSTPSNFGFVNSAGLSGSGTGPFTFSVSRSDLGLSSTAGFSFEGTLVSTSGYRSNETIGTSVTIPGSVGDIPNAGFTGSTTFATANNFAAVPEPASIGLLALAGLASLRRRRN